MAIVDLLGREIEEKDLVSVPRGDYRISLAIVRKTLPTGAIDCTVIDPKLEIPIRQERFLFPSEQVAIIKDCLLDYDNPIHRLILEELDHE